MTVIFKEMPEDMVERYAHDLVIKARQKDQSPGASWGRIR